MKRLLAAILLAAILASCGAPPAPAKGSSEAVAQAAPSSPHISDTMITNGDFSSNFSEWYSYHEGGSSEKTVINGEAAIIISQTGTVKHGVQLYQDIPKIEQGCRYRLTFTVRAEAARTIGVRIQMNGGDYAGYLEKTIPVNTEHERQVVEFLMDQPTDPAPRLVFNLGRFPDDPELSAHTVWLDDVALEMYDDSGKIVAEDTCVKQLLINLNQLGYRPGDEKYAVFSGEGTAFEVINEETGAIAFTGALIGTTEDPSSGQTTRIGDFSDLRQAGTYRIKSAKLGESFPFVIGETVYDGAFAKTLDMFTLARCGTELTQDVAGEWAHKACHTSLATVYGTGQKLDVTGGWHDAGDYGRYVVPGAKAAADLLLAWQLSPASFAGEGMPSVLAEVRYELDWLLKMQDSKTGGVYHKVTTASFEGEVMPDAVTDELILSPISTAATADFAAVMAMAYPIYLPYDAAFAKTCLAAARRAWQYALDNPLLLFKNPEGIVTGEYSDPFTADERFWAACELYKATGESVYQDYLTRAWSPSLKMGLGWADVGTYGLYAYLSSPAEHTDGTLTAAVKDALVSSTQTLANRCKTDGYRISLGTDYQWGSNMTVANNAMQLLLTDSIAPDPAYRSLAAGHLHYLLGANCLSYSYLTGFGSQSPTAPHHRPSMAAGKVQPGMLVGGPNGALQDPYARAVLKDLPPAQCYVDNDQSYSTNEIAIYWNSPLAFVLSCFAMQEE